MIVIRTQDRLGLIECENIQILEDDNYMIINGTPFDEYVVLGEYATEQRALKVLDEIQLYICRGFKNSQDIYDVIDNAKKQLNRVYDVYEMPKE